MVILVIVVSMTLHEAMHAYSSYWLGDDTAKIMGRLSLNPIKHIDPVLTLLLPIMLAIAGAPVFGGAKPVPINSLKLKYNELGLAIVAISGPLTNLIIAFLSIGIWSLLGAREVGIVNQLLVTSAYVNLGFFVFNMIPIPPLDGSRVLYFLAPEFVRSVMKKMESYGIIIVFSIVFFAGMFVEIFMINSVGFIFNAFCRFFGV